LIHKFKKKKTRTVSAEQIWSVLEIGGVVHVDQQELGVEFLLENCRRQVEAEFDVGPLGALDAHGAIHCVFHVRVKSRVQPIRQLAHFRE